ncbi:MAG: hypothetical protein U0528_20185 [Anaerolineae bacterium]
MANLALSDLFKFVTLRAPENFDHQKDLLTIIRDNRIPETYVPGESHDVTTDSEKFRVSSIVQDIFAKIESYLPLVTSNKDVITYNDQIAEEIKTYYSLNERTNRPWLDDFVAVTKRHQIDFDRGRLLSELDAVVKKHHPELTGIRDYLEVIQDGHYSRFCYDFEYLYDRLYVLYVCKRLYPINLEYVIDALKALHVIRLLKIELDQTAQAVSQLQGCLRTVLTMLLTLYRRLTNQAKPTPAPMQMQKSDIPPKGDGQQPAPTPVPDGRTDCAITMLTSDPTSLPQVKIRTKENLQSLFSASPFMHQLFACLLGYYAPFNSIRPIGIGDLLVVKQFLTQYEAGEIAHVENVLKGESKDRSHRRLNRTEDVFSTDSEKTEVTEKELQTTDRYELKTETESTIQNDLNARYADTSISGKYGVVEYSLNAGVSYSNSTTDSRKSANNFAKDIVDRSLTKVEKRVRQQRTSTNITEVEEINKHGLNNVNGSGHITGIYRWLNKRYKAQVYNYGKRLMFEFVIPEPAAFIQAAFEHNRKKENKPDKPQKPTFPALDISQITEATVNQRQFPTLQH